MAGSKAFTIILIIGGGFIGVFIILQGSGLFLLTSSETEETFVPTFECLDYVYSIDSPRAEGNTLSFTVSNKNYGKLAIPAIEVLVGNITQTYDTPTLVQGKWQRFDTEWEEPVEEFDVYVPGCVVYAEHCLISDGECI